MKRFAPAADRNKGPILEVLRQVLPQSGLVLELASGSGQHAAFFADALRLLQWQPSDSDAQALDSIAEYVTETALPNLLAPILLDARSEVWPLESACAVVCANMVHIAPWAACVGLLRGTARILSPGGALVMYGPFCIHGDFGAESNVLFDQALRGQNEEWGVRELEDIEREATAVGLSLAEVVPRPANNHMLVFRTA